MAGRPHPRRPGALENEVVACLAAADRPLTTGEVREQLGDGLAYTTVLTTLSRLHAKEAVTRSLQGRAYAFALIGTELDSQAQLAAREMRKQLDAGVDRATVLMRFVNDLDDDSERILRDLLERHGD